MTKIFGILNVTPDSFSDGGKFHIVDSAIAHAYKLIEEGANIIDIGAESASPGAKAIDSQTELNRLKDILPNVIKIAQKNNILTSIDTYHYETAKEAIRLGIDIINDVSNSNDLQNLAKDNNLKIIIMHNLGIPASPHNVISNDINIVEYIKDFALRKIEQLDLQNHNIENIIFDPGIGFGKTSSQSFEIIKNIEILKNLNLKILVGHSRKSFYNIFTNIEFSKRDLETHITSAYLASKDIDYLRVHDVAGTKRALKLASKLLC